MAHSLNDDHDGDVDVDVGDYHRAQQVAAAPAAASFARPAWPLACNGSFRGACSKWQIIKETANIMLLLWLPLWLVPRGRRKAAPHIGDATTCNACLPAKQDAFFKYFPVAASTVSALITGSTRRASPCPGRVACATCGATTLPRPAPHQLVAAIYGYERASSATLVATIYAAYNVAGLLLHAVRCEGAKLPRCKVHEAVAMPHIWPKQDSA